MPLAIIQSDMTMSSASISEKGSNHESNNMLSSPDDDVLPSSVEVGDDSDEEESKDGDEHHDALLIANHIITQDIFEKNNNTEANLVMSSASTIPGSSHSSRRDGSAELVIRLLGVIVVLGLFNAWHLHSNEIIQFLINCSKNSIRYLVGFVFGLTWYTFQFSKDLIDWTYHSGMNLGQFIIDSSGELIQFLVEYLLFPLGSIIVVNVMLVGVRYTLGG